MDWVYELKKIADVEPRTAFQLGIPGTDLKKAFEFVELVLAEAEKYPIPRALAYAQIGVTDLDKARTFYDRVLGRLDMKPIFHHPTEVIYGKTNPEFFITTKTNDKRPMIVGNAYCSGFWANSVEQVNEIYREAIDAGGSSVSAPAYQTEHLYTCYVQDLDENVLEIMKWFDNGKPTG